MSSNIDISAQPAATPTVDAPQPTDSTTTEVPPPQGSPVYPQVYIGPSSPKLGLKKFGHYVALNKSIKAAIEKYPALKLLFVPLDQLGDRRMAIYAGSDAVVNHAVTYLAKAGVL